MFQQHGNVEQGRLMKAIVGRNLRFALQEQEQGTEQTTKHSCTYVKQYNN